jgi:hypothetical protein
MKEGYRKNTEKALTVQVFLLLLVCFFCSSFVTCAEGVGCKDTLPDDFWDICILDCDGLDISESLGNLTASVCDSFVSEIQLTSNITSAHRFVNFPRTENTPSEEVILLHVLLF